MSPKMCFDSTSMFSVFNGFNNLHGKCFQYDKAMIKPASHKQYLNKKKKRMKSSSTKDLLETMVGILYQ
jgi:DNA polymerase sigma